MSKLIIGVIGSGYVGLTQGIVMAHKCTETVKHVSVVDIDKEKVDSLTSGNLPIVEEHLPDMLRESIKSKRISFGLGYSNLEYCNIIFVAVGTPTGIDGRADTSFIFNVARDLSDLIKARKLPKLKSIVIKSTVPIGTTLEFQSIIDKVTNKVDVIHCPEFLREGTSVDDVMNPDRIIVGVDRNKYPNEGDALEDVHENLVPLLSSLVDMTVNNPEVILTTSGTSEMVKYFSNISLALRIAHVNEMADLATILKSEMGSHGPNIEDLLHCIAADKRIGKLPIPGPRLGGSCFIKDVSEIATMVKTKSDFKITQSILGSNEDHTIRLAERVSSYIKNRVHSGTDSPRYPMVLILGLAFKAGTDDVRETAAAVFEEMLMMDSHLVFSCVTGVETYIKEHAKPGNPVFELKTISKDEFLEEVDIIVILTEYKDEFSKIVNQAYKVNPKLVVFDYRGMKHLINPALANSLQYFTI